MNDPVAQLLTQQAVIILDGALATELEHRGVVLDEALWSAALLVDAPEAIERLHLDYLEAGADCIVSASYQATLQGFEARGLAPAEAEAALLRSVELALSARESFWKGAPKGERLRPLVAAGVGPYGAFLADGSEFTGDYDLDEDALYDFHRRRWHLLAGSGADLLACETIPSLAEARALARLVETTRELGAWLSFSCRDGERISDGAELAEVVRELEGVEGILAIGVNCTAPEHISSLLRGASLETDKPLIVYPNSGETWDAAGRRWIGAAERCDLGAAAPEWIEFGARLLGGCCRTSPQDIRRLRSELLEKPPSPRNKPDTGPYKVERKEEEASMQMAQQQQSTAPSDDALATLFQTHSRRVLAAAYRVTGSRQDAEDALQTVFLRLTTRWKEIGLSKTPGAYLRRAAVNAAIDLLRSRAAAGAIPIDDMGNEPPDKHGVSPERRHSDREFRRRLRQALLALTDRNAQVFCLRYFEDLTNKEIAEALGLSQTRVAVILHRARKRLQPELLDFVRGDA